MGKHQTARQQTEDEKLWFGLVKERLITEAQLHTAQDYQRAVGGNLDEIILRLGFVDRPALERFLAGNRPSGRVKSGGLSAVPEKSLQDLVVPPPLPGHAPERAPSLEKEKTLQLKKLNAKLHAAQRRGLEAIPEKPPAPSPPPHAGPQTAEKESEGDLIIEALMRVLIRKGLISGEEIDEEIRNL